MDYDDLPLDDPVAVYLREVKSSSLTREEEKDCIDRIRRRDKTAEQAKARLVKANLELVVSIARRHHPDRIHILDLIQDGNEGLLLAVNALRDVEPDNFASFTAEFIERTIRRPRPKPPSGLIT